MERGLPRPEWEVLRGDDDDAPDSITAAIVNRIIASELVVADLTGANPNVMYELAIAHGFRRPVVHICAVDEVSPFDVRDLRIVFYDLADPDSVEAAAESVGRLAKQALLDPEALVNPVSAAQRRFELVSRPGSDGADFRVAVLTSLEDIKGEMDRTARRLRTLEGRTVTADLNARIPVATATLNAPASLRADPVDSPASVEARQYLRHLWDIADDMFQTPETAVTTATEIAKRMGVPAEEIERLLKVAVGLSLRDPGLRP